MPFQNKSGTWAVAAGIVLLCGLGARPLATAEKPAPQTYLGFDANDYPGDDALLGLRRTFVFSGYWLNVPPGAKTNSWEGKRAALAQDGFGFLVLFDGRFDRELRSEANAVGLGAEDAKSAAAAAQREGFPPGTIIFLDQEEGGRMLPEQMAYVLAWSDGIISGGYRAGIYCSGMPVREGKNQFVVTANDIRERAGEREIAFFVYNDACPPSPGCAYMKNPPAPASSGFAGAWVWQFAQSPRRRNFTAKCAATYSADGNCYPPGGFGAGHVLLDLDSSVTADPSTLVLRPSR